MESDKAVTEQIRREEQGMVEIPFPLVDGTQIYFWIPKKGLTHQDANRLELCIRSMVTVLTSEF